MYMQDPWDVNDAVGHRRWILFPPTRRMGTGGPLQAPARLVRPATTAERRCTKTAGLQAPPRDMNRLTARCRRPPAGDTDASTVAPWDPMSTFTGSNTLWIMDTLGPRPDTRDEFVAWCVRPGLCLSQGCASPSPFSSSAGRLRQNLIPAAPRVRADSSVIRPCPRTPSPNAAGRPQAGCRARSSPPAGASRSRTPTSAAPK